MTIADTDVLIDYLAGKGEAGAVERLLRQGALRTTVITRFELLSGAKNAKQLARLVQLLDGGPVARAQRCRSRRCRRYPPVPGKTGNPIGMADSLIAGIVATHGGTLLTRNRRHFERVPGIRFA